MAGSMDDKAVIANLLELLKDPRLKSQQSGYESALDGKSNNNPNLRPMLNDEVGAGDGYWDAAHQGDGVGSSFISRGDERQAADPVGRGPTNWSGSVDDIRASESRPPMSVKDKILALGGLDEGPVGQGRPNLEQSLSKGDGPAGWDHDTVRQAASVIGVNVDDYDEETQLKVMDALENAGAKNYDDALPIIASLLDK